MHLLFWLPHDFMPRWHLLLLKTKSKHHVLISLLKNNIIRKSTWTRWNWVNNIYLPSRLLNQNYSITAIFYDIFNCKQKSWLGIQTHAILYFSIKLLTHIALSTSCPFPFEKRIQLFNLQKPAVENFGSKKTAYKIIRQIFWMLNFEPCNINRKVSNTM